MLGECGWRGVLAFLRFGPKAELNLLSLVGLKVPRLIIVVLLSLHLGIHLGPCNLLSDHLLLPLLVALILSLLLPYGVLSSQGLRAIVNPSDLNAFVGVLDPAEPLTT